MACGKKRHRKRPAAGYPEHREAARIHSCMRLMRRYNVLTWVDQRVILTRHEELIQTGREPLGLAPDGSEVHEIVEDGTAFYPCWKPEHGFIATYLTRRQAHVRLGLEFLL